MPTGQDPEMPTTPLWRRHMREAREIAGWSQTDLSRKVGVSQPIISNIETGELGASSAVLAISRLLRIPPPYVELEDATDERLLAAARAIRARDPRIFEQQLQSLELLASLLTPQG